MPPCAVILQIFTTLVMSQAPYNAACEKSKTYVQAMPSVWLRPPAGQGQVAAWSFVSPFSAFGAVPKSISTQQQQEQRCQPAQRNCRLSH